MTSLFYARVKSKGAVLCCAAFLRGGNWNNGANTGAFTLNLNNAPSNTNTNIGFRCASDLGKITRTFIPRQNEWCEFMDLHPGFMMITELFPSRLCWENIKPVFRYGAAYVPYRVSRQSNTLGMRDVSPFSTVIDSRLRENDRKRRARSV